MSEKKDFTLHASLTDDEALAFAQFLKRIGHSDYRRYALNEDETFAMKNAGEEIRKALAEAGFYPR